ncbi:MAG: MBL fold metallo-hydrolase [Lachnospiraceae bacterium]|nr:MBL fold metallo-hydrolase [Lachnospiraceae bacterium]
MKLINLIENTEGTAGCAYEHGLSFYAETKSHKILIDLGPTESTLKNASVLGIDLKKVDTVILSHGHYDHSGGIMPFSRMNGHAAIIMQRSAVGDYYADDGENAPEGRFRYIGIDRKIRELPQTVLIEGDHFIDDELELFTIKNRAHELPFTNKRLLIKEGQDYKRDDFSHEHFLVLKDEGKRILVSGCAHNGVLNIIEAYKEKYDSLPDAVISGFHLSVKRAYRENEIEEIKNIATELSEYPVMFYTCHCTGTDAYDIMKSIMGEKLKYVHSGEVVF